MLSTFPSPTIDLVTPETVPVNVGEASGAITVVSTVTVGVAASPELLASVTPVPATREATKLPAVSAPKSIVSLTQAEPFHFRNCPDVAELIVVTKPFASTDGSVHLPSR